MSDNSFFSGIKFSDFKYFPYGFSRSGDFNFKEADALTDCGFIMKQLAEGKMAANNEEQEHFLLAINGTVQPLYFMEQTYLKYLKIILKKESPINSPKSSYSAEY